MADDRERSIEEADGPPITLIVMGVVAALFVVFMLQNTSSLEIQFLLFERESPMWLALLIAFVAGAVVGQLGLWWFRRDRD